MLKDLHGPIVDTIPAHSKLQEMVPFEKKNGRKYLVPVWLTGEHGVTYSRPDNGAFTLEESVAAISQEAQVEPYQLIEKATMSYEAAFRSEGGGQKAHVDGVVAVMKNVVDSLRKRTEMELFYGRKGAATEASSASTFVVIAEGAWSAASWGGMKGAKIAILNSDLAAAEDTDETIASIDLATRTLVVGNAQTLDAGDLVYFKGQVTAGATPTHNSMPGLEAIATNTGTLFNIDAATYELWKGTEVTSVGQASFGRIMNAVSYAVQRGCMEDLVYFCSTKQYEALNGDMAGLRRLDTSYKYSQAESGHESLCFYGQSGKLEIIPHLFVRDGDGFVVPIKRLSRMGSTDITFKRPSANGDGQMVLDTAAAAGFELRAYTAQSIFCEKPAWLVKLSGITYSGS